MLTNRTYVTGVSERAEERGLLRDIDTAARRRFGQHAKFRIYIDTADGDEDDYCSCLHYEKRPPNVETDIMFPSDGGPFVAREKLDALRQLLKALEDDTR